MVKKEVAFFRGRFQFLHKKNKSEIFNAKKTYKQWIVGRFKRRFGEKEGMVLLRFWKVGGGSLHPVLYTNLTGKHLPLFTSGISTALSGTFLVLLLPKQNYYVHCPYHSHARNTECLLLYFSRCHYLLEQWTISLICVIISQILSYSSD